MDVRRRAILVMRDNGMTYDEIGEVLGISRQRAHQIAAGRRKGVGDHFHKGAVEKIPYIGLREWLLENRVTITELTRLCGVRALKLTGKHSLRKRTVERLLEITGLSFEECFRRDDHETD